MRWRTESPPGCAYACLHVELSTDISAAERLPWSVVMLQYALVFLVIALIAGVLGFTGIAGASVGIAKILFLVFIVLFLVSFVFSRRGRF